MSACLSPGPKTSRLGERCCGQHLACVVVVAAGRMGLILAVALGGGGPGHWTLSHAAFPFAGFSLHPYTVIHHNLGLNSFFESSEPC